MIVFLERGAAAAGVGNDGIELFAEKYTEIFASEFTGGIANACVRGESATTKLTIRNNHFATVGSENANGGLIELRKGDIGDASGKKGNAYAAWTRSGKGPAEAAVEKLVVNRREKTFALGKPEKFQNADAARDSLQAGALVEAQYAREINDAMGSRKQVAENEIASNVGEPRARIASFDARACVLDELSIFDAGGAGGFAAAAVETFIDVVDEGICDGLLV